MLHCSWSRQCSVLCHAIYITYWRLQGILCMKMMKLHAPTLLSGALTTNKQICHVHLSRKDVPTTRFLPQVLIHPVINFNRCNWPLVYFYNPISVHIFFLPPTDALFLVATDPVTSPASTPRTVAPPVVPGPPNQRRLSPTAILYRIFWIEIVCWIARIITCLWHWLSRPARWPRLLQRYHLWNQPTDLCKYLHYF